jgi:serine/threonine-protein phosphatase PP1 catalytic subunit
MVVGDIHGDLDSLEFLLDQYRQLKPENLIFLGDYVDRGLHSGDVLERLFRLKLQKPGHVCLLKGNHEIPEINRRYGLYEQLNDKELFGLANRAFDRMPVAAILAGRIFCVHGGIDNVRGIKEINKEGPLNYLWSDPSTIPGITSSVRGPNINNFGPDMAEGFLGRHGLDMIIRGHSALQEGYRWWFGHRLLSLYSTTDNHGRKCRAAFALVKKESITVFLFEEDMKKGKIGAVEDFPVIFGR